VRARTVPILLAVAVAAAGCGSDQVSQEASQPAARGDAKDSLFRARNLRRALDVVRRRFGASATLTSFRLEAGALKAEVVGGAGTSVVVSKRFRLTSVPTPGVTPSGPDVPLALIDRGAPERIMAQVTSRTGVGLRGVDYFVILAAPGTSTPGWVVYLRNGKGSYSADLSGDHAKPLETTPTPTPTTPTTTTTPTVPPAVPTPTNPATTPSTPSVQRELECIRRAANNPAKIQACLRP
jgi:hypothetical protein